MGSVLGVGVIGASASAGWARVSHVPALRALAGLELGPVSAAGSTASTWRPSSWAARQDRTRRLGLRPWRMVLDDTGRARPSGAGPGWLPDQTA